VLQYKFPLLVFVANPGFVNNQIEIYKSPRTRSNYREEVTVLVIKDYPLNIPARASRPSIG